MASVLMLSASQKTISPSTFSTKPGDISVNAFLIVFDVRFSFFREIELVKVFVKEGLAFIPSPSPMTTPNHRLARLYQPGPVMRPYNALAATTSGDAR